MSQQAYKEWAADGRPEYTPDNAPGRAEDLKCGECSGPMRLRNSKFGMFYGCLNYPTCKGTIGAHPWGEPKGIPAGSETRNARMDAHSALDRLWMENLLPSRGEAYSWLSRRMGIMEVHIGEMDVEQCQKVVELCKAYRT